MLSPESISKEGNHGTHIQLWITYFFGFWVGAGLGRAKGPLNDLPRRAVPAGIWQVLAGAVFVLGGLLWAMAMFNTYLTMIPGVSAAVTWLQGVAGEHLGAYTFAVALLAGLFTLALRVGAGAPSTGREGKPKARKRRKK